MIQVYKAQTLHDIFRKKTRKQKKAATVSTLNKLQPSTSSLLDVLSSPSRFPVIVGAKDDDPDSPSDI